MRDMVLRLSVYDIERISEAISAAQEVTEDQEWNRDVQVIKTRLNHLAARARQRAAREPAV